MILLFARNHVVYRGGSMYPTLKDRELLLMEPLHDLPREGDVVVFADGSGGHPVVHRVVRRHASSVQTRGDNNSRTDEFRPGLKHIMGRVAGICRAQGTLPIASGWRGAWVGRIMRYRNALARLTFRRWRASPEETSSNTATTVG